MKNHYPSIGNELYVCPITEAKDIIKVFTECRRMGKC